jgi:uncharacterized protein (DUF1800 family)
VRHVAAVFRATNGDLPQVYRAIIFSDEFMDPRQFGAKFKTPFEFVVTALRATGAPVGHGGRVLEALEAMGQPVYQCDVPTGYDDAAEGWADPGALVYRWDFALRLSDGRLIGASIPSQQIDDWQAMRPGPRRWHVTDALLPGGVGAATTDAIADVADVRRLIGLLMASPEFQQQ